MKKKVLVLAEAASDIEREPTSTMRLKTASVCISGIRSSPTVRRLGVYFGEHRIHLGYFHALPSRFPYAIYYRDMEGTRQVVAMLNLRRSPEWIRNQLSARQ